MPKTSFFLKISIQALDLQWEIELKENAGQFQVIVLESAGPFAGRGNVWHGQSSDAAPVEAIMARFLDCCMFPSKPSSVTILDGTDCRVLAAMDGELHRLAITGDALQEVQWMAMVLQYCKTCIADPSFETALHRLGTFADAAL